MSESGIKGLQFFFEITEILLMLFADDVILLSDTVVGLQRQLSILEYFCDDYHVEVNTTTTKLLFSKTGIILLEQKHGSIKVQI